MNTNLLPGNSETLVALAKKATEEVKVEEDVVEQVVEEKVPEVKDMPRTIEDLENDEIIDEGDEYSKVIILDNFNDPTKQDVKVDDYEFNEDDMRSLFFGASNYGKNKTTITKESDLFDVFEFYKKESRYIDVYLEVTNVAVRIFEFNNAAVVINKFLNTSQKDFAYRAQVNMAGTQTRDFVEQIFKNAQFLTSDGETLTPVHFEMISSLDIPFLILGATKLLGDIYEETDGREGYKISDERKEIWIDECPNCGQSQNIEKNVAELLRAQYTQEAIDWANKNYDPNDTLENNIRRSKKVRAKGVRYTKGDSGIETIFLMKDPDWIRGFEYDKAFDAAIVNKYSSNKFIQPRIEKNQSWLAMTTKERASQIYAWITGLQQSLDVESENTDYEDIIELRDSILLDSQTYTIVKYLHTIKIYNNKVLDNNGKPILLKETEMATLDLATKMKFVSENIDLETVEKLLSKIEEIRKFGRDMIEYKFKCVSCGHEHASQLDPILFVFLLLQSSLYKKERMLSSK